MSSKKTNQKDDDGGYSIGTVIGAGTVGLAAGALFIKYFSSNDNQETMCNAAGAQQATSHQQSDAFANRQCTEETCVICQDKISPVVELPCTHRFHRDCILKWINENGDCPTCRRPAPADQIVYI